MTDSTSNERRSTDERRYRLDQRVSEIEVELAALRTAFEEMQKDYERHHTMDERHHETEQALWRTIQGSIVDMDKRMTLALHGMELRMQRQQSFIGGVVFVVGAMFAVVQTFWNR